MSYPQNQPPSPYFDRFNSVPGYRAISQYWGGQPSQYKTTVYRMGEMIGFSPNTERWYFLSSMQVIIGLWFLGFGICFLIESLGKFFINQWLGMIFWTVGGGLAIFILQGVAYIAMSKNNQSNISDPVQNAADPNFKTSSYLGSAHMKELFMATIISIFIYAIGFWVEVDWLQRYHPHSCCGGISIDFVAHPEEYITYRINNALMAVLSIFGFLIMLRAFYTHINPLTTLFGFFNTVPDYSQTPQPGQQGVDPLQFASAEEKQRFHRNQMGQFSRKP